MGGVPAVPAIADTSERTGPSRGERSKGQLLTGLCVCISPATGDIHICTMSLAEGGVFKELVMLDRHVCSSGPHI